MTAQPNPPAGWYADPSDASQLRWWDGAQWTEHLTPVQQAAPAAAVAAEQQAVAAQQQSTVAAQQQVAEHAAAQHAAAQQHAATQQQAAAQHQAAAQNVTVYDPAQAQAAVHAQVQASQQQMAANVPEFVVAPLPGSEQNAEEAFWGSVPSERLGDVDANKGVDGKIFAVVAAVLVLAFLAWFFVLRGDSATPATSATTTPDPTAQAQSQVAGDPIGAANATVAQANMQSAANDMESCAAAGASGSYEGCDAQVHVTGVTVTGATATGYTLTTTAGKATFTYIKTADSQTRTCTPPGEGGCDANGSWGAAAPAQ
jgi:hypothetical protein